MNIGELAKTENKNWVWQDAEINPHNPTRALVSLSYGGSDAAEIREFDLKTKTFVKDGFFLPLSKGDLKWKDADTVYVSPALEKSDLTQSGYPRRVFELKRGEALNLLRPLVEAKPNEMAARVRPLQTPEGTFVMLSQVLNFYQSHTFLVTPQNQKIRIPFKDSVLYGVYKSQAILQLRSDYETLPPGSLISIPLEKMTDKPLLADIQIIFKPTLRDFLGFNVLILKNHIVATITNDTLPFLYQFAYDASAKSSWIHTKIKLPQNLLVNRVRKEENTDRALVYSQDILTPTQITLLDFKNKKPQLHTLFKQKPLFNAQNYTYTRYQATSLDGTQIPYFVVSKKNLQFNSHNPTLLFGYGGFRMGLAPDTYNPLIGKTWLEHGGVYIISNLRGGGEFGPEWHRSAIKFNKMKSYEDFAAVAADLTKRKISNPDRIAILGGSNGGLLVGATMTLYPNVAKAAIAEVPLLDMLRYHKLLAGASWMAEYGDPEKEDEAAYIRRYSPYQNIKEGVLYPSTFLITSTKDDRVHPGHARKMYKKMKTQGHEVYLYENSNGGHGRASDIEQKSLLNALKMTFLFEKLRM